MNTNYNDFIGIYTDLYPEGFCPHLIGEFERLVFSGSGSNRRMSEGASKHRKDDMQLSLNIKSHNMLPFNGQDPVDVFFDGLQKCFNDYVENYSVLENSKINCTSMKMQRTSPGGGYHIWHAEREGTKTIERVLVYILYLNDLDQKDAGETEFLYQKIRIRPEENKMVIWPAAYTHTHRGNVVHGNKNKYIVTGWFYYE